MKQNPGIIKNKGGPGNNIAKIRVAWVLKKIKKDKSYYLMFLPVVIFLLVFNYAPMVGLVNALFNFTPFKHEFIGFDNFIELFTGIRSYSFWRSVGNTLFLSLANLVLGIVFSVVFALLLNEVIFKRFKKFVQTILYLPHFLSWIVAASVFAIILSPQNGLINNIRGLFGEEPIYFLAEKNWWTFWYLFMQRWKETGWGTIIFLAALSGINPELYEAAIIDGAGRWRQTFSITLPAISTIIMTVFILNLGRIMYLFYSVFAMQNPLVFGETDVLQTFAYRVGIEQAHYGMGTAISFFASVVGFILVMITNRINKKIRGTSLL